jgi:hypothetical protein
MDKQNTISTDTIDCACVIHGSSYDWVYVERLYNMLDRYISRNIRLHVYTEASRPVPAPMVKHVLTEWPITRARRGWWYKMQLFNSAHHAGPLLYFDLDTVIVQNIDWIWAHPSQYLWAPKDFKYLWKSTHSGINSSVMWWDTTKYQHVWEKFARQDLEKIMRKYHGDQEFISDLVPQAHRRFLDPEKIQSWRWQCLDGGYDFRRRRYQAPDTGTKLAQSTAILVFHGSPKPHQIADIEVVARWL